MYGKSQGRRTLCSFLLGSFLPVENQFNQNEESTIQSLVVSFYIFRAVLIKHLYKSA